VILVVLPAYNEEAALGPLLVRLARLEGQLRLALSVLVVDDGSTDDTAGAAARAPLPVMIVRHPVNRGLGEAIKTGLLAAVERADDEDVIVLMDADDTHSPALIQRMVDRIEEGSDVVIASRYLPESRVAGLSAWRRFLSAGASWVFRIACPVPGVKDYTCGYRAYRALVLRDAIGRWGADFVSEPGFTCNVDILLKLSALGAVFAEVPLILRYDRKPGASKMAVGRTTRQTLALLLRHRFGGRRAAAPRTSAP